RRALCVLPVARQVDPALRAGAPAGPLGAAARLAAFAPPGRADGRAARRLAGVLRALHAVRRRLQLRPAVSDSGDLAAGADARLRREGRVRPPADDRES